jgi:ribonuclease HII
MKYIVGVDEVGRGPLAGPVTVGVVVCEAEFYKKLKRNKSLPPLGKDSKKLSPDAREKYAEVLDKLKNSFSQSSSRKTRKISAEIFALSRLPGSERFSLETLVNEFFNYSVIHISNKTIDKIGIAPAIGKAIVIGMKKLKLNPKNCEVRLDGGLSAPAEFKNQKTIVKGDEKEKIIAWASILAKVSRDALLRRAAKKFPQYGFEIHKGYGTARHRRAIKKHGLSLFHRKSFRLRI